MKLYIKQLFLVGFVLLLTSSAFAQKKKKNPMEIYECGHVHKLTLKEKMNPARLLAGKQGSNPDLGTTAISVFYQANLHPQAVVTYVTKVPGWETCGDAVFASFTNREGIGFTSTDGQFLINGEESPFIGFGTFFKGFKPEDRGEKDIKITSSNGDVIELKIKPAAPFEIKSIDGKAKGEVVLIDGSKDIVIELIGGDADPNSQLHIQMAANMMGARTLSDVIVVKAKNTIVIPKEAFMNFEGSPAPFATKNSTLVINRITEKLIEGSDAGAIRALSGYMDWNPVKLEGKITKGSIVKAGFDESKNTTIGVVSKTAGGYDFKISKGSPYNSPPVSKMKKIAIASFVVRGNLSGSETTSETTKSYGTFYNTTTTVTTTIKKWFPEMSQETWQKLADSFYQKFTNKLGKEMNLDFVDLDKVVSSEAYKHVKPLKTDLDNTFVQVGAGSTERILPITFQDYLKDLSISFGSDFVAERLVQELDVDAVLSVIVDFDFNFETGGLDPKFNIVAFAPNISYKTSAQYFKLEASTQSKSIEDSKKGAISTDDFIYQIIKGDDFLNGLVEMLKELSEKEKEIGVYQKLWKARN